MIIHLTLLLFRHNKQTQYNHKDSPIGIGSLLHRSIDHVRGADDTPTKKKQRLI